MFENYKEKMGKYENIYLYGNGTFTEIVKKSIWDVWNRI